MVNAWRIHRARESVLDLLATEPVCDRFGVMPKPTVTVRMGEGLAYVWLIVPCCAVATGWLDYSSCSPRISLMPPRVSCVDGFPMLCRIAVDLVMTEGCQ